jgi:hypothetical protein
MRRSNPFLLYAARWIASLVLAMTVELFEFDLTTNTHVIPAFATTTICGSWW